jgi:hypothetical protein
MAVSPMTDVTFPHAAGRRIPADTVLKMWCIFATWVAPGTDPAALQLRRGHQADAFRRHHHPVSLDGFLRMIVPESWDTMQATTPFMNANTEIFAAVPVEGVLGVELTPAARTRLMTLRGAPRGA